MAEISIVLRFHIKFFEVIGFTTRPLAGNCGRSAILWSGLLLVLFNIAAYTALFSNEEFLFKSDMFGCFNDTLKVVFGNIAVTCCYWESMWKRCDLYEFWKNYDLLQIQMSNGWQAKLPSRWLAEISKHRRFLIVFYVIVACEFTAATIFIMNKDINRHLILLWSIFTPFIFATHMRNMQFIFFIEVIRLELVKLKDELHLLVDYSILHAYGTSFKTFEEFLRLKIVEKQKEYQLIYEMYVRFQKAFGFSMVAVLLMIYVRVLVDAYFYNYMIYRQWPYWEAVMLVPACLHIPIFLIFSKNCMDVVQYICCELHCIISQFNNQNTIVTVQLQNFSLQLLHQQICINGIGIARMDGYMLTKVIASITTYMIFFIQFMPKFSNISV